ncbi:MAG: lipopolysaccharide assembly protein LapB, partial [Candidatus Nitrotoga sp.]
NQSYSQHTANFYCELATAEIEEKQIDMARVHLEQALQANPNAVRATIMSGDLSNAAQDYVQAIAIWQRVEQQNAQYLPMVAERLLQAYRKSNRADEGIAKLQDYLKFHPSLDLMNVLFEAILQRDGVEEAYKLVRDELQRNPTLLGLDKLLEARLLEASVEHRADVEMVKKLVHQRTRSLAMYRCGNCGFKARHFYWHCPACYGWETYSPRRSEESGLIV